MGGGGRGRGRGGKSRSSMDNWREQQHRPDATFIFILISHPASFQQRLTQFSHGGKFKEPRPSPCPRAQLRDR